MSAPVLFVNIMGLSYVLHCCNEGCSRGQSVLIVLIWSCASEVICQRSGSHELLQIGQGDSERDSAVNYGSDLKPSKNWKEQQREAPAAPALTPFLADGYRPDPAPWRQKAAGAYARREAEGSKRPPHLICPPQRGAEEGSARDSQKWDIINSSLVKTV